MERKFRERLERESERTSMAISVSSLPTGGVICHHDRSLEQEPKVAFMTVEMAMVHWATQPPRDAMQLLVVVPTFFFVVWQSMVVVG